MVERYKGQTDKPLSAGKHKIEILTKFKSFKPLSSATVTIKVDGKKAAEIIVSNTVPAAFSASECFNVGMDLGSPLSLSYFDKAPFKFDGKIYTVKVNLL